MRPVVLVNADIRTMDACAPRATAVAMRDGVIAEVGPAALAQHYPDADVVDVGGRLLLPGFIDAHHHLSAEALHPIWVDLSDAADTATVIERLRRFAQSDPATGWIRGCQWNSASVRLSREDLDAVGTDRPILVACSTLHRGLVSAAGIDALGISPGTSDPPGGKLGRDATGAPNGFLREAAWGMAHAATVRSFGDPDRWGELIVERCHELLRQGITAVHDTTVSASAAHVYESLARAGTLPISVLGFPHAEEILTGMDEGAWRLGPTGEGTATYRTGPVKLFADGGPDLAIDACSHGKPVKTGMLFPQLREAMGLAVERGFSLAVHAMGDAGLRHAIGAWKTVASASTQPIRIEHATLAGPNEIKDLKSIQAIAVVQPSFVDALGPIAGTLQLDEATWMPFRELHDAGLLMAASSDSPCSISAPLRESSFGVTRRTSGGQEVSPAQSLPYERWLELYTAGSADAGQQTDERGRLRAGLRADFVVLDGGLADPSTLRVAQTWASGERRYSTDR
jgi:predicted amidohydrolase YtcJ